MENKKSVLIIGAGPAGISAAKSLADDNVNVTVLEKEHSFGGNINNWAKLFPNFKDAAEVKSQLVQNFENNKNIKILYNKKVTELKKHNQKWIANTSDGEVFESNATILSTGFKVFDAKYKEELGYGIYPNVITSVEFERMYKDGKIHTQQGSVPKRIAFLNCVGSRDEKVGNHYCSRICCIAAVKQAIEFKELYPESEAFIFYMDIRMAGQFYEELYRKSQEKHGVVYIRGRISETSSTIDKKVQIKAEDTLAAMPLRMTVDMLVLMVGVEASETTTILSKQNNIDGPYGFAKSIDIHTADNYSNENGLFLAGSCKRPLTLTESIADGKSAAFSVIDYLKQTK